MKAFWNFLPNSTKLLVVAVALMFSILLSFIAFNGSQSVISPSPTPQPSKLNVLERGIPNVSFSQIEPQLQITDQEASGDGSIVYTLQSDNPARPDQIISKNGKVIFERIYIPDSPSAPGYMTLNEVEQKYGPAEEIVQGSKFWGGFLKTYIYASKGYAFIANPFTKEIFEMHTFTPMSSSEYKQAWGDDISGQEAVGEGL